MSSGKFGVTNVMWVENRAIGRCSYYILFLSSIILLVTSSAAQAPLLQITSPLSNTVITAGQAFTITISADPSVQLVSVGGDGQLPGPPPDLCNPRAIHCRSLLDAGRARSLSQAIPQRHLGPSTIRHSPPEGSSQPSLHQLPFSSSLSSAPNRILLRTSASSGSGASLRSVLTSWF